MHLNQTDKIRQEPGAEHPRRNSNYMKKNKSKFDPEKLTVTNVCPREAYLISAKAVWKDIAKVVPDQRVATLRGIRQALAEYIDEDLRAANEPNAERERLVSRIYCHILCIMAAQDLMLGKLTYPIIKPRA